MNRSLCFIILIFSFAFFIGCQKNESAVIPSSKTDNTSIIISNLQQLHSVLSDTLNELSLERTHIDSLFKVKEIDSLTYKTEIFANSRKIQSRINWFLKEYKRISPKKSN